MQYISRFIVFLFVTIFMVSLPGIAGNKKIMSVRAAKVLAERALVESVYGFKIRSTETVENMIASNFEGKTETKTRAEIKGIKIEDVAYDASKDIARATASITLHKFTNIDGVEMDFQGRTFKRVAFATSTPAMAGPVKALRAAELDAYKQLAKRIVGFTLESHTTVENYMLKSDLVKSKVLATVYLARVSDYGWDESGDAYIKMVIDTKEVSDVLGEKIMDPDEVIEVEGNGAQVDDFTQAQTQVKSAGHDESASGSE